MGPWIIWIVSFNTPPITSLAPQNAQPRSESVPGMVAALEIGRKSRVILAIHLEVDVLFAFRNVLVAFQQNHRHELSSSRNVS